VIYSAAIAYNFDLTMSEVNNLNAGIDFLGPWQGMFTLGVSGDANRTRANERTFTITDTFNYLRTTLNTPAHGVHYCDGHVTVGPNYIYPIVGRIGIYNTVYTFFQLSIFDNLAADKAKPGVGGTPALADLLTFTTMVDVTATPKVVFAPVSKSFHVTDASLSGMASRKDIHQLTLGLALDSKGTAPLTALRGYVFSRGGTLDTQKLGLGISGTRGASGRQSAGSQTLVLNRVTASTTSPAEQIAVAMIDQLKSRELQLIPSASP